MKNIYSLLKQSKSNQKSHPLIPGKQRISKNNAILFSQDLDEQSMYSLVSLCSIYHKDVSELRRKLRHRFAEINCTGVMKLIEFEYTPNVDNFEEEIKKINLKQTKDMEEFLMLQQRKYGDENKKKALMKLSKDVYRLKQYKNKITQEIDKKLFFSAFFMGFFTFLLQFSFILILIYGATQEKIQKTNETLKIIIKVVSFFIISLFVYSEYKMGKIKLNHALFQGFLYKDNFRRCFSAFLSIIQMINAICFSLFSALNIRNTVSVKENIKSMSSLLVILHLDNWLGDYFLNTSERMRVYSRECVSLPWCIDKSHHKLLSLGGLIETLIFIFFIVLNSFLIYESIDIKY